MPTALEGVRVQHHAPTAFYPLESPDTHCTGGWVGPRAGLERGGKSRPPPGFDPRTVQPVASRYTDWATRPTKQHSIRANWNACPGFRHCWYTINWNSHLACGITNYTVCVKFKKVCIFIPQRDNASKFFLWLIKFVNIFRLNIQPFRPKFILVNFNITVQIIYPETIPWSVKAATR